MQDCDHGPRADAAAAGLLYVEDGEPGLTRRKHGRGFRYLGPGGESVDDPLELQRIRELAVPPAWTDVWICSRADGHLQATGRDAAGRKQYVYHQRFTEVRDAAKFARLAGFGARLPSVRRRVRRDLGRGPFDRSRLTAAAVRLMDVALIRVGNARSASNGSYGVTTLRNKHVTVDGAEIGLRFVGKAGERHALTLVDEELAAVIRDCQDVPGYELFRYRSADGEVQTIGSSDVNDYLRRACGEDVSAKDFRTWGGTVAIASSLHAAIDGAGEGNPSQAVLKRSLAGAVRQAASVLGNTPAVCRRSYVHPAVIDAHLNGTFADAYREALGRARAHPRRDLRLHESATLEFLAPLQAG